MCFHSFRALFSFVIAIGPFHELSSFNYIGFNLCFNVWQITFYCFKIKLRKNLLNIFRDNISTLLDLKKNFSSDIFWENIFTLLDLKKNFSPNIFWENIFTLFDLKKISRPIYFEKIYYLIWRKYTVWFEENFLPNIVWENILFVLKKIYCRIYFEKIYYLIWRKFLAQYSLRKYIVWFEENFLPIIFWENIFTLFDLKKITYQLKSLCFSKGS